MPSVPPSLAKQASKALREPVPIPSSAFAALVAIERKPDDEAKAQVTNDVKAEVFQSIGPPWKPGIGQDAFGGHVLAQSAYAASKTVPKQLVIHNISGIFVLRGRLDVPFVYTVRHIRDGGAYCTRAVDARQDGQICFTSVCSFKRPEKHGIDHYYHHQLPAPLTKENDRYNAVLLDPKTGKVRSPEGLPLAPGVDAPWYVGGVESGDIKETEFPGTEVRKVDMTPYNETDDVKKNPHKYRQLQWYRFKDASDKTHDASTQSDNSISTLKRKSLEDGEYDNLFACAHLYASDKNSLFIIPRALGDPDGWITVASLSISVIFHQHGESIRMLEPDSADTTGESLKKKWFLQESSTARSGENRGLFEERVWTSDGILLATVIQDSLVRYADPPGAKL